MIDMLLSAFVLIVSFCITYFLTPILIRKLKASKIVGEDIHKKGKPEVAEMGGIAIIFGLSAGIFTAIPFMESFLVQLLAALLTIMLAGIIGICDDLFGISQKKKAFLPIFASIPLIAISAGTHVMSVPFIGQVDFGLIYPLILIPAAVTVVSNAFNMLAGYNGLEAGLGLIACFFLGLNAAIIGEIEASVLMFAMAGALLGFLIFNKYPAKIFPGDVGTLIIGVSIASAVIISNMELIGMVVILPYLINGAITVHDILRKRPLIKFSGVDNKGILIPPTKGTCSSLYFLIERRFLLTEKRLVYSFWIMGVVSGIISLLYILLSIGF